MTPATIAALAAITVGTQGPRERLQRAADYMGGETALRAVTSVSRTYQEQFFAFGQAEWPGAPVAAQRTDGREHFDHAAARRWITVSYYQPRYSATFVSTDSTGVMMAGGREGPLAGVMGERLWWLDRLRPEMIVLTALSATSLADAGSREISGRRALGVQLTLAGQLVIVWTDERDGMVQAVEAIRDDAIVAERRTLVEYGEWTWVGPVRLPRRAVTTVNGMLESNRTFDSLAVDAPPPGPVPARLDSSPWFAYPTPVSLTELAPGVHLIGGAGYNSLFVVQDGAAVLVEAPVDEERVRMVLDTLARAFPAAPVRRTVITHHHWDHIGGLRESVSRGLLTVASEEVAEWIRGIRAREPRGPEHRVTTVADSLTLGSGATALVLYEVDNPHARGLLVAWHPASRVLFEADLRDGAPHLATALVRFVESRNLPVSQLVSSHAPPVAWEEFAASAR